MKNKIPSVKFSVLIAGGCGMLGSLSGCADVGNLATNAPGLYDVKAWNGIPTGGNPNPNSADNPATSIDTYGNVWQNFFLTGPKATVKPSGTWTEHVQIVSGSLPPGLDFDSGFNIVGTPTQAGNWIATLNVDNIQCSSKPNFTFYGFQQQVRFHISGYSQQPTYAPSANDNNNNNYPTGGGCFLTTACVHALGLSDDCHELTVLRNFRDSYLKQSTCGREAVEHYYRIAPQIVSAISKAVSPKTELLSIYETLVSPSVRLVEATRYEEAFAHYQKCVLNLATKFCINS